MYGVGFLVSARRGLLLLLYFFSLKLQQNTISSYVKYLIKLNKTHVFKVSNLSMNLLDLVVMQA